MEQPFRLLSLTDTMLKLSKREIDFINSQGVSRLATATLDSTPHVKPVCHAFDGKHIYIATDYGTKKLKNLKVNKKVSLTIDAYSERWGSNRGITINGEAEVLERGSEYKYALKLLFAKFPGYRANPWGEGEAPIVRIKPLSSASWRLG